MDNKLSERFRIIELIGKGSFGQVYLSKDKKGREYASKVEKRKKSSRLLDEHYIYRILRRNGVKSEIPTMYNLIQTPNYNILVMELLGQSLDSLFYTFEKKFTLSTVLNLAIDILKIMKNIHRAGIIHRDIKPNNFLVGHGSNSSRIILTDFGLSKKYIKNDKHIAYRKNKKLIGTLRYASINMHNGIEPSRRDDLESCGYMFVYFLKGSLPWQGLKKNKKYDQIQMIEKVKKNTPLDKLCSGLPNCFKQYLKVCRKLDFYDKPPYNDLIELFVKEAKYQNLELSYQWCKQ